MSDGWTMSAIMYTFSSCNNAFIFSVQELGSVLTVAWNWEGLEFFLFTCFPGNSDIQWKDSY